MPNFTLTLRDQQILSYLSGVYEGMNGGQVPGLGNVRDCTPIRWEASEIKDPFRVEDWTHVFLTFMNPKHTIQQTVEFRMEGDVHEEFKKFYTRLIHNDPTPTSPWIPVPKDWPEVVQPPTPPEVQKLPEYDDEALSSPEIYKRFRLWTDEMNKGQGIKPPFKSILRPNRVKIPAVTTLRSGLPELAYALECECGKFNCTHIMEFYAESKDTPSWWEQAQFGEEIRASKRDAIEKKGNAIQLAIPIFGYVLHRVVIECQVFPRWDGGTEKRFMVSPFLHTDTDRQHVYPVEGAISSQSIMRDQINLLEDSVLLSPEGQTITRDMVEFMNGNSKPICVFMNQPGMSGHNFGTTKKLMQWLKEGDNETSPEREGKFMLRQAAAAFTLMTYGTCYICYRSREPVFSMTPDLR